MDEATETSIQTFDVVGFLSELQAWFMQAVWNFSALGEAMAIAIAFVIAWLIAKAVRPKLEAMSADTSLPPRFVVVGLSLTTYVIWMVLQWTGILIAEAAALPSGIADVVVSLLTAWVVIRVASSLILNPIWARFIATLAWTVAALSIVGLLGPISEVLDGLAMSFGDVRISALTIIQGILLLIVLLWVATTTSGMMERRIHAMPELTPSIQVLLVKSTKLVLMTLAIFAAVGATGIDLSVFAFFGGALGLGIGFGMQRIVSNLVSGVILLLDRSVKPGDFIAVGDTYGWIDSLGARYASVVTRDGTEHLIPNEELITTRVENWSHSNNLARLRIAVGVAYDTDLDRAIEVCVESARKIDRVLKTPEPKCLVKAFGDSSVELEVRIWINDPQNGRASVKSDVMLEIWRNFREAGIQIPFPQRDLWLRNASPSKLEPAEEV